MAARQVPVAIVGMAVLLPGAADLDAYWRNLRDGVDAIGAVPDGRWDAEYYHPGTASDPAVANQVYARRGGFVDGLAQVEVTRFGIMPNSVAGTEPDQLIALHVASAALDDAGGTDRLPDRGRVGVVLGRGGYLTPGLVRLDQRVRTAGQLVRTLAELIPDLTGDQLAGVRQAFTERLGPDSPESAIGLVPNLAASRVANRLDLRGPAYTVDAACASSLVAVDQAVGELASGRCDVMLAGGVHHCHDITLWSVFSQLRALSPSQRIRPFHRDADGILIGEGTGVVVLKRLADAERAGDRIYAVVRGTGVASDGRAAGLMNPEPGGQAHAVRQAWRAAGLDPAEPGSVGLLEAHGTATPAGDSAELATLADVFGPGDGDAVLGSVKSMIGHAMPAAGVAGLVKAALAVHHRTLLPTLHCDDPHPALARTRFRTLEKAADWETTARSPVRRAAVNAFGFGGINAHVVLEEAPDGHGSRASAPARPVVEVDEPEHVLLLAAESPAHLAALLDADDDTVRAAGLAPGHPHPEAGPARLGIVGPTAKRLALARRAVGRQRGWHGRGDVWFRPGPLLGAGHGRLAFLFPGLEGEFTPQVDDVAAHFGLRAPAVDGDRTDDVGRHGFGVVAVGRLLDAALRRSGIVPDAVAGHSVGEWTAMAAAGLYSGDEVDAFMAAFDPDSVTVPGLAFGAIGTSAEHVLAALRDEGGSRAGLVLSHDNAPGQSMVCGPQAAVEDFVRARRAQGVLSQVLPFQSGFHTPMLRPHVGPMEEAARRFRLHPPHTPLWSGTTAAPFPEDETGIRALFVRHLLEPVRFRQLTEALNAAGHRVFVQVGPGQLGSLVSDTLGGRDHLVVAANSPHRTGLAQLRRVATALWTAGSAVAPSLQPAETATTSQRPPVRLDLSGALVSLSPQRLPGLRAGLRAPARAPVPAGPSPLDSLAESSPVAAELSALLSETADTAAALMSARTGTPAPAPSAGPRHTTVHVSPDTMPYLLDHCFFPQRPGWPEVADRWPVVPATTIVQHIVDAAQETFPGGLPVAVHGARFDEWLTATPAVDVPVTVTPKDPGLLAVSFGPRARATVELAGAYPTPPPAPWVTDPGAEHAPDHTAAQLYAERWMFHGPAFQGVSELTAIGDRHVRGRLTTPSAPGALLDNVGQLLGYWIMATRSERTVVFPVGMREMRFYGPHPAPGTEVECLVRVTSLTDALLEADVQLRAGGTVWAELYGWQDRRFDNDPQTRPVERFPDRNTLSEPRPGGWRLLHERWPDLASRELIMRNSLGGAERAEYARHAPRGRRQWLLGRIAVKDAVRQWLWDHGEGPVFPAELRVHNDETGRPYVTGVHGRPLPPLDVSLAHCAEAAVAIVRPHRTGPGPGIDIEEVTDRTPQALAAALAAALGGDELRLLHRLSADTGESEAVWFTRFWAAKESVAKAEGTGFGGRPRDFTVFDATPAGDRLAVAGRLQRTYTVHCVPATNPPRLPERAYAVAWTTGNPTAKEYDAR
ncbi:polyketide synthase dehydratase domain-containing protein [Streptomyces sp. NBC_01732]|uniref:beta-ketoacyl synthase N-terminal-like domain-containing protein n=2 Tax=Streptomyces TaxID=1883 RepID=UPI000F5BC2AF|nr:beta-ketoacyl synthase N-terminal-like domain-containing protein [Streptomyces sp. ADI95-17]WSG55605.1 polyketide synthase dehydratase domain-containing protein [Streptomyces sp. NBC_01732]WSX06743.1 polyketide synthase dehydratase domain-containing protein [Streptomyces sp. NBC_00987]